MNADQIKIKLLDHLIQQNPDFITSELPFFKGFRRADIVAFSCNTIHAFEIKSDHDNLRGLEDQMNDYSQVFPISYLVTTHKHLNGARQILPKYIGIIIVENQNIQILREARERKRLSKYGLLLGIPIAQLGIQKGKYSYYQTQAGVEELAANTTLGTLKSTYYQTMKRKYFKRYSNFLADRGELTTLSDLFYLEANFR